LAQYAQKPQPRTGTRSPRRTIKAIPLELREDVPNDEEEEGEEEEGSLEPPLPPDPELVFDPSEVLVLSSVPSLLLPEFKLPVSELPMRIPLNAIMKSAIAMR